MPNWFPSYTNCSSPSGWYGAPIAGLAAIGGIGLGALLALGAAGAWAPGVAAFLATACLAGILYCTWWLNVRLICLGGDRSAVGAVYNVEAPTPSFNALALGDYDNDYSFNFLVWPFLPQNELPNSFVSNQTDPAAFPQLVSDWPTKFPSIPWSVVSSQVPLILFQQSMRSLNLGFTGQDVESGDEPNPQPKDGSPQHFLLHCEIEGAGIHDLRTLLWVLFGIFSLAAILYLIPIVGPILSWVLSILAFLAFLFGGPAIQNDVPSPPSTGGWGGSLNPYAGNSDPNAPVDLAYVYGRWVYDSWHQPNGWNEFHPLHFMLKIGQVDKGSLPGWGAWGGWGNPPGGLQQTQAKLDAQFNLINSPGTAQIQAQPENQWLLHPLLDGCVGQTPYPLPPPPQVTQ